MTLFLALLMTTGMNAAFAEEELLYSDDASDFVLLSDAVPDALFPLGHIAEHSGHSRGSTVDLTLFDRTTEKEVDMGGAFDYFGELSHPDNTGITEEQYPNRTILREAMLAHGFKPLEEEWRHFTLEDEPYPNTYFSSASLKAAEEENALHAVVRPVTDSPDWVANLPAAQDESVTQLFVVAALGMDKTTAAISMHQRDEDGGCVAIPEYCMRDVMLKEREDCVVLIDTLDNLGGSL